MDSTNANHKIKEVQNQPKPVILELSTTNTVTHSSQRGCQLHHSVML